MTSVGWEIEGNKQGARGQRYGGRREESQGNVAERGVC